jgi:hypothetical protein
MALLSLSGPFDFKGLETWDEATKGFPFVRNSRKQ